MSELIPHDFSAAEKRIIREFLTVAMHHNIRGSMLYRFIAQRLYYKIDKNNTNAYVRTVLVKKYRPVLESIIPSDDPENDIVSKAKRLLIVS